MKKSIVIGAGIAGIATSIRLAKKGYAVEVYESNAYAGKAECFFKRRISI